MTAAEFMGRAERRLPLDLPIQVGAGDELRIAEGLAGDPAGDEGLIQIELPGVTMLYTVTGKRRRNSFSVVPGVWCRDPTGSCHRNRRRFQAKECEVEARRLFHFRNRAPRG